MPSRAAGVLLAGALAVALGAIIVLATDERTLAFSNGVAAETVIAQLAPGQRACQPGVVVAEPFAGVELVLDTGGRPGPPLELTVRERRARDTLATGKVRGGYAGRLGTGGAVAVARLRRVRAGRQVQVCVANAGRQPVGVTGTSGRERREPRVQLRRPPRRLSANLHLNFLRPRPTSLLAELPRAFERAALWHPPLVGAWTFWLLAALVGLGVPLLLAWAVYAASALSPGRPPPGPHAPPDA